MSWFKWLLLLTILVIAVLMFHHIGVEWKTAGDVQMPRDGNAVPGLVCTVVFLFLALLSLFYFIR